MGTFYELFGSFIDWIETHQTLTGLLIFLVAMTESLVLVGILVPGAVLMVGTGILISLGKLELWPCLAWAASGAIAGDGISFYIGYHYKDRLRQMWPFTKTKLLLVKGEEFFQKHGGTSVVLGRFFGPVRAIVPTIAGMLGMQPRRFAVVNVLSALAWAPAYILPGLVVGASLQLASEIAFRLVIVMVLLVIFYVVFHWLIKHTIRYLQHHTQAMAHAVLSWSGRHPFIGKYTGAILKPDTPAYKSLIISGAIFLVASLILVITLVFGFGMKNTGISYTSYQFFQSLRSPLADHFMVFITMLAEPSIYLTTLVVVSAWLIYNKMRNTLIHFLFASGMTAILMLILAVFVHTPEAAKLSNVNAASIAHTILSLVIFGFIAILLTRGSKHRGASYITVSSLIILIVLSKLYLGHFWLSEIIASIMLGLVLLSLIGISLQKHSDKKHNTTQLLLLCCLTLIVSSSIHIATNFEKRLNDYQPKLITSSISFDHWWNYQWKKMPEWRNDLRSHQRQPMNIQFAGDLEILKNHLREKGWRQPAKFHVKNMVHWLNSGASLSRLPVLPQVHQGRHHLLIMTFTASSDFWRATPEKQWVLRLWKSRYQLSSGTAIYIGNVSTQTTRTSLGILSYPNTSPDFNSPMHILLTHIKQLKFKIEKRPARSHKLINWDGQLLLFTGTLGSH